MLDFVFCGILIALVARGDLWREVVSLGIAGFGSGRSDNWGKLQQVPGGEDFVYGFYAGVGVAAPRLLLWLFLFWGSCLHDDSVVGAGFTFRAWFLFYFRLPRVMLEFWNKFI